MARGRSTISQILPPGMMELSEFKCGVPALSGYPQKPYALKPAICRARITNVVIFGWPEESDYVMLSRYGDKSLLRNELSFMLFSGMGHYASRLCMGRSDVKRRVRGIYLFGEKIKKDSSRSTLPNLHRQIQAEWTLPGATYTKIDAGIGAIAGCHHTILLAFPHSIFIMYFTIPGRKILPEQKDISAVMFRPSRKLLYSPQFQDPLTGYGKYIDVPSFIDYFLVNEVSRNNDIFKKSYYFYKDRDDHNPLIKSGPVWDFDWAWKNIDECYIFRATDGSGWAS